jgi:serum/glucocorticoid-regulated kinase 2
VRTDDLESTRVERAIKRVRSDIAMHGGTNVPLISTTAPGSTRTSNASADGRPGLHDRESSGFPGQSIKEEDEGTERNHSLLSAQPVTPDTASADEHARRLVASGMVDFTDFTSLPVPEPSPVIIRAPLARTVEAKPEAAAAEETGELTNGTTAKAEDEQKPVAEERQSRIPRSVSADRDKASRRSRSFQDSPILPPQSETEAEATEATDAEDTDAFGASAISDAGGPGPTDQSVKKKKKKKQKLERKARKVVIDDFEMMRVLGKGCAGKVLLVRHKRSQSLYALKAITKRHVLAHQELQHTMTEQAVLKRMARSNSDPFVVKLYWSFHDKENLFLVMVRMLSHCKLIFYLLITITGLPPGW